MEIRNPNQTHLPELHALLQRCLDGAYTPQQVAERIFYEEAYDPNHVWMAREQGRMLGFLHTVLEGEKAYIKLIAVAPEHRRRGLGRDMLSRAEYRLSGEGAREAWVTATPPRDFLSGLAPGSAAAAFFAAQGYEPAGQELVRWAAPVVGAQAPEPDRHAAGLFAREHAPGHWGWIEDALACRPAKALYRPGVGLLLAEPGESLGPLWPAPGAAEGDLRALALVGLALASMRPVRDARGLRLHQVPGSLALPLEAALQEPVLSYRKTLL